MPLIFTAEISKEIQHFDVEYIWTVEGGRIVGEPNIKTVKIIPEQCTDVKATFTIKGLPEEYPKTVSEVAGISDGCLIEDKRTLILNHSSDSFDQSIMFDEFRNLSAKDEKIRFDNLFRKIKDDDSQALIILKFAENNSKKRKLKGCKLLQNISM